MLLRSSAFAGFVAGALLSSTAESGIIGLLGFFGGSILAFLTFSYLVYGR